MADNEKGRDAGVDAAISNAVRAGISRIIGDQAIEIENLKAQLQHRDTVIANLTHEIIARQRAAAETTTAATDSA